MGLLSSDDVDYMRTCLNDVAADVEEAITYKQFTSMTAGNPVMGTPDTPNYTSLNVTATARELSLEEIKVSGGVYVLGDMEFKIRSSVVAAPAYADRIVYSGSTYKPKSINHVYLGGLLSWTVRAEKL
ncbi:MAG: hypothetical protein ACYCX4_02650 [Bacillota bacterium]